MEAGPDLIEATVSGQHLLWGLQGLKGEVDLACAF
jgi:hypothetical protein